MLMKSRGWPPGDNGSDPQPGDDEDNGPSCLTMLTVVLVGLSGWAALAWSIWRFLSG